MLFFLIAWLMEIFLLAFSFFSATTDFSTSQEPRLRLHGCTVEAAASCWQDAQDHP